MKRRDQRRWVPLGIVACTCAVGAIVLAQTSVNRGSSRTITTAKAASAGVSLVPAAPVASRKALDYYTGSLRKDVFGAPLLVEKPKVEPPKVETVAAPVIVDPFVDYSYTGTVVSGDHVLALVENVKTKEGLFLTEGDDFLGGKVGPVSERTLTVNVAGASKMLSKTDNYKLAPLDKSAPYLTASVQTAGAPGQMPSAMQMGAGGMMTGGAPVAGAPFPGFERLPQDVRNRIMERMNSMPPAERQQMQDRMMNRRFDGGGRGGGGGRRGGGESGGN